LVCGASEVFDFSDFRDTDKKAVGRKQNGSAKVKRRKKYYQFYKEIKQISFPRITKF
jgi:hypothetical protein